MISVDEAFEKWFVHTKEVEPARNSVGLRTFNLSEMEIAYKAGAESQGEVIKKLQKEIATMKMQYGFNLEQIANSPRGLHTGAILELQRMDHERLQQDIKNDLKWALENISIHSRYNDDFNQARTLLKKHGLDV